MKFPKDRNTLMTVSNLKNVTSLMFHYQITQGILRVDSQSVSGNRMEGPTDLIVGLSLHTHGISHELVVGSMKMQPFQMNWLQLRLMIGLLNFPKALMMKSVTSLMKFPKDQNTLTMKNVNSLMKFPKDRNTFTTKM